ncbi:hypothetical protein EJB05_34132, partial [Eragrostis curvula]
MARGPYPVTEVASIGEGPREGLSRLDSEGPREVIEVDSTREGSSSMDKLKMLMQRLLNFRIFRLD